MTERKIDQKKEGTAVQTFTVPFSFGEIKENFAISTSSPSKSSKEQIINQAFKYHTEGNLLKAEEYYQYCINKGLKDYRIFSNYAVIAKDRGNIKEAEILIRKAIKLSPYYDKAHSNLGTILMDLGNLKEAEISLRKAIEINPNLKEAYFNLGKVLKNLNKLDDALYYFEKAIELKMDYSICQVGISEVLLCKGNFVEGLEKINKEQGSIHFCLNRGFFIT